MGVLPWFSPDRMPVVETLDDESAARFRAMTPAQRTLAGLQMHQFARLMIAAHLRAMNPRWNQSAIDAEVSRRMLDGAD
jgi:hypothetical protein